MISFDDFHLNQVPIHVFKALKTLYIIRLKDGKWLSNLWLSHFELHNLFYKTFLSYFCWNIWVKKSATYTVFKLFTKRPIKVLKSSFNSYFYVQVLPVFKYFCLLKESLSLLNEVELT